MSYKSMCAEYGTGLMERVVKYSTLPGRKEWQKGKTNWELDKAIYDEYNLTHTQWLGQPVCNGSKLTAHTFPRSEFSGITWSDVWSAPAYFTNSKHFTHLSRVLSLHERDLPPADKIEPLPEQSLRPTDVGGDTWHRLFDKGLKSLPDFYRKVRQDGIIDLSGVKNIEGVCKWMTALGITVKHLTFNNRDAIYIEQWARQKCDLLTTPIPYLCQVGRVSEHLDVMTMGCKTFKDWALKGYPVSLFADDEQRRELLLIAQKVKSGLR